jgi:hypothetical protein
VVVVLFRQRSGKNGKSIQVLYFLIFEINILPHRELLLAGQGYGYVFYNRVVQTDRTPAYEAGDQGSTPCVVTR